MDGQGRILIVDDLDLWREELTETLQRGGYYVDSSSSVEQALKPLDETFYHLLILDMRIDDSDPNNTDGINLLSELKRRGLHEATKVIMLSAFGTKEHMRTAF